MFPLVLRTRGRAAKGAQGLRQKADLGWDSSLAIFCCVTLGMELTLSAPQFPAFRMGVRAFHRGRWDHVNAHRPDWAQQSEG